MTCYHPLIRVCKKSHSKLLKSQTVKIIGSSEYGENFLEYFEEQQKISDRLYPGQYEYQRIPCGKCIGCRLDYSKNGQRVAC